MKRTILITLLCSLLSASAWALSLEIPVTPQTLDQAGYTFAVSHKPAKDGVAYQITITSKMEDIFGDSKVGLCLVTKTDKASAIETVQNEPPIALKKEGKVWKADFTASNEMLNQPNLCFVFTVYAHSKIDGKMVRMPSAGFYEINLNEFRKS